MIFRPLKKTLNTALLLNIILVIIILSLIILSFLDNSSDVMKDNISVLLILVFTAFTINIYILARSIKMNILLIRKYAEIDKAILNIETLNNSLRAQRHDFLNHLQVVHGLIELEEFNEAGKYIKDVYSDIQKVSKFLRTSQPAINALIQAKTVAADKKQINVELDIKSKLDQLPMDPWEVCRILGNLIDNAVESLMNIEKDRKLSIIIHEKIDAYLIKIIDNGPKIPEDIKDRIFEPGFTTKAKEDKGMGLTIVKNIIEEAQGSIGFQSDDESTCFIIEMPKKTMAVN